MEKTHIYTWDDYVREQKAQAKYEGKEETILEVAKSMLIDDVSIKTIMKYTGLSKEEIENLS